MPGDCTCKVHKADRGWFERFHYYCKNRQNEEDSENDCFSETDAFKFIVSIAIPCGVFWIIAGGFSFLASASGSNGDKRLALISASIYLVTYIMFAGLFGAVMNQVNYRNFKFDELEPCDNVKKRFRRSGDEFLGCSICGFVLIMISIICTVTSVSIA